MGERIVEISGAAARLSVRNRQLVVAQEAGERSVPVEDLAILILDRQDIVLTQPVLTELAAAGAALAVCGADHHPAALCLPLAGHWEGTAVGLAQTDAGRPLIKRLWRRIVMAKIGQQAAVLDALGEPGEGLAPLAARVRSGDPDNLEAQAAQRYWPALLGRDFRRRRDGDPPNNLLNYGYAVLRAALARAVVGAGLIPMLGLHHRGRGNPFCLADDLMEPFRPYIDHRVAALCRDGPAPETLGRGEKAALISVLHERVQVTGPTHDGRALSVLQATRATATSLARTLRDAPAAPAADDSLTLPTGVFLPAPAETGAKDDGCADGPPQ